MDSASRRITKLQRHILRSIRAEMRRTLGPQPVEIRRYHRAYDREFQAGARRKTMRQSTKEELVEDCLKADIILMGDYHTFALSQKAALRLLREINPESRKLALGLEMIPSAHQPDVDRYLKGETTEAEFLEAVRYETNWGFPWKNFKPLLDFARGRPGTQVLALNSESESLDARDRHAADLIGSFSAQNPDTALFVLYGDLHLAHSHIPAKITAHLRERAQKRRIITVFQNNEAVYWHLMEQKLANHVEVMKLGRGRYCVINAAPWVKLQSYLEWAESSELFNDNDEAPALLDELVAEHLANLGTALELEVPKELAYKVHTINQLEFLRSTPELGRAELKALKYKVLGNRNAFVPGPNIIYLSSPSVNSLAEGVSLLLHASLSGTTTFFHDPRKHFFGCVLSSMIAYFGSKLLNHKRKCSLEEDYRATGHQSQDRLERAMARFVLRHLHAQHLYRSENQYRAAVVPPGRSRLPVFLEASRRLGAILGEKLYAGFAEGTFSSARAKELFSTSLDDPRSTRKLYLALVSELDRTPLSHTSKLDLF